jgi:hypothetical protein
MTDQTSAATFIPPGNCQLGRGSVPLSGRRYMGLDLEAKYVELARRRLAGVDRAKSRRGP